MATAGQQVLIDNLTRRLTEVEGTVDLDRPEGFEENNGCVHSLIPVRGGLEVIPKWIQKRNDGKVGLRAGKDQEEPTYVTKLYADPDYLGDRPICTMAPWLRHLLAASNGDNHVVHTALLNLDEWGLQADAERYKRYSDARARIHNEMQLLEAEDAFYQE